MDIDKKERFEEKGKKAIELQSRSKFILRAENDNNKNDKNSQQKTVNENFRLELYVIVEYVCKCLS